MKRLILFVSVALISTLNVFSQKQEAGIRINNTNLNMPNTLGFVYKSEIATAKKGKAKTKNTKNLDSKYRRYRVAISNGTTKTITGETKGYAFNVGGAMGTENRKYLGNNFSFIHGPEAGIGYKVSKSGISQNNSKQIGISAGYIMGLHYNINDNFCANIEAIPAVTNTSTITNIPNLSVDQLLNSNVLNIGFSSTVAVTFSYKF